RALLYMFQDLRAPGFEASDEESRARIGHRLHRLVIAVHARRRRPLKLQRLEFAAKVEHAVLADVEGIVVEDNLFHLWEAFERLFDLDRKSTRLNSSHDQ